MRRSHLERVSARLSLPSSTGSPTRFARLWVARALVISLDMLLWTTIWHSCPTRMGKLRPEKSAPLRPLHHTSNPFAIDGLILAFPHQLRVQSPCICIHELPTSSRTRAQRASCSPSHQRWESALLRAASARGPRLCRRLASLLMILVLLGMIARWTTQSSSRLRRILTPPRPALASNQIHPLQPMTSDIKRPPRGSRFQVLAAVIFRPEPKTETNS